MTDQPVMWTCRTCKRTVATRYLSAEHDAAPHIAYQHRTNLIVGIGFLLMFVGLVVQVIAMVVLR